MLDQLQMFTEKEVKPTLSPLVHLAKILASLGKEQGWEEKEVLLSPTQSGSLLKSNQSFLSGKMLREHSPQMMAQTFGLLSKPLPTLGAIDLNGNCLIHHGFYPKTGSEYTLSDLLEQEVDDKYFLSEKKLGYLAGIDQMQKSKLHHVSKAEENHI